MRGRFLCDCGCGWGQEGENNEVGVSELEGPEVVEAMEEDNEVCVVWASCERRVLCGHDA